MRVTVIFDNFGPYHHARLCASARLSTLTAIQISARSADYAWENEARAEGFAVLTLFPDGTSRDVTPAEMARRMATVLTASSPEAVFIPGWASRAALAALLWCVQNNVPAVVMSESTAWDEKRVGWKELIKRRLVTLFSAALVGGHPHADYVVQLGMTPDRVVRGYDAVDNVYFRQNADQLRQDGGAVRNLFGLPPNYFLASARFIEKKNLPRLLEAYARYRERCGEGTPWSLVLLGDGTMRGDLEKQITALSLGGHVQLPGFRQYPELPAFYACAGAFIHASTVEQWGLVVNEAMAAGLPVIVSDRCGCASDLVHNGRNGFTFDPQNVEELAALMHQVYALAPEARLAMAAEGRNIIAQWSPTRFAEGLEFTARKAVAAGPVRMAGSLDRWLCRALMRR